VTTRATSAKGKEASAPAASPKTKPDRFHTIGGVECKVLRTEYDVRQNIVFDYVERKKVVRTRTGAFEDVSVERRVRAPQEIQDKYVRVTGGTVTVEE
jgi:hypothetical protein